MKVDTLILGGRLFDPAKGIDRIGDLAINEGKIVSIENERPTADIVIDAKDLYVMPGFIDLHTHLFSTGSGFGANADLLFPGGTTTAVDMGSAGCANFEAMLQSSLATRQMRSFAFLNVSPVGQTGYTVNEPLTDGVLRQPKTKELIKKYPDIIRGLKVRVSKQIVGELGIHPLVTSLELAEENNLPLCVHTTNPPVGQDEIAGMLREGDLFSHVYHGTGNTILDENGKVLPGMWEAKNRGVLFDVGNGRVNFDFDVAKAAIEQGFFPDTITTDATPKTLNTSSAMKNLPFTLSKFMAMGMSLQQVIATVTGTPAKILGQEGTIGTLAPGAYADVTIVKCIDKEVVFQDSKGNKLTGYQLLVPYVTIANGSITYCRTEFLF